MLRGTIWKISANHTLVRSEDKLYDCQISGRLKKDRIAALKLATVGDEVDFEPLPELEGHIVGIQPRRTKLSRHDVINPNREQVIVANAQIMIITQSTTDPPLNTEQIDRCLIMAQVGNMEPWICINKVDLAETLQLAPYAKQKIFYTCAATGGGVPELRQALQGKFAVLLGPSGVGKSSLLNAMGPGLRLKVREVSLKTREGRHTTSWIELLQIGDAIVADTPGLEFFTLWGVEEEELPRYFEEFEEHPCRYRNCTHIDEPACGVKAAVASGAIFPGRYQSYLKLLEEIRSRPKKYRREGRRKTTDEPFGDR